MSSSGSPCSYLAIQAMLPFMEANERIKVASSIPAIRHNFHRIPTNIDFMSIGHKEIIINKTSHKFSRLMSVFSIEETEYIQVTVNDVLKQLIQTKAPVAKVMNAFLEHHVNRAKIVTLDLKTVVTADIQVMVRNLVLTTPGTDLSKILSPKCLPLLSAEIMDWNLATEEPIRSACLLVAPNNMSLAHFETVIHKRVHLRPSTGRYHTIAVPEFLMWLESTWATAKRRHWSFEIESLRNMILVNTFLTGMGTATVRKLGGYEVYHVECPRVPGESLMLICHPIDNIIHVHCHFIEKD